MAQSGWPERPWCRRWDRRSRHSSCQGVPGRRPSPPRASRLRETMRRDAPSGRCRGRYPPPSPESCAPCTRAWPPSARRNGNRAGPALPPGGRHLARRARGRRLDGMRKTASNLKWGPSGGDTIFLPSKPFFWTIGPSKGSSRGPSRRTGSGPRPGSRGRDAARRRRPSGRRGRPASPGEGQRGSSRRRMASLRLPETTMR
jgi:hypothetical protein